MTFVSRIETQKSSGRRIAEYLLNRRKINDSRLFSLQNSFILFNTTDILLGSVAKKTLSSFVLPRTDDSLEKKIYIDINYLQRDDLLLINLLRDNAYSPWGSTNRFGGLIFYYFSLSENVYFFLLIDARDNEIVAFLSPYIRHSANSIINLIILIALSLRNYFPLHAALVADERGQGILLAGKSGCGKTTLSGGLHRSGLQRITDDVCVLYKRREKIYASYIYPSDRDAAASFYQRYQIIPKTIIFPKICPVRESSLRCLKLSGFIEKLINPLPTYIISDPFVLLPYFNLFKSLAAQCEIFSLKNGLDFKRQPVLFRSLLKRNGILEH